MQLNVSPTPPPLPAASPIYCRTVDLHPRHPHTRARHRSRPRTCRPSPHPHPPPPPAPAAKPTTPAHSPLPSPSSPPPPPHLQPLDPPTADTFPTLNSNHTQTPNTAAAPRRPTNRTAARRAHSTLHHNYYHSPRRLLLEFETSISARYQLIAALSAGSTSHKPPHSASSVFTRPETRDHVGDELELEHEHEQERERERERDDDAHEHEHDYGQYQVLDRATGHFRALWAVRLSSSSSSSSSSSFCAHPENDAWLDMQRYFVAMEAYTHPNLPRSVRVERFGAFVVMTWAYCARGSAHDVAVALRRQGRCLRDRERMAIEPMLCVTLALSHLHAAAQAHGDVRPRNILRTANGRVKLHGLRVPLHNADPLARYAVPKEARFVAPEMREHAARERRQQETWRGKNERKRQGLREKERQRQKEKQTAFELPSNAQLCAADMYAVGVCLLDMLGVSDTQWNVFQFVEQQQPQQLQQQQGKKQEQEKWTLSATAMNTRSGAPSTASDAAAVADGDASALTQLSPFSVALLKGCLARRPHDRLSAAEAVQLCYQARQHVR